MVQLEGTENRISVERKNYIEQVNDYNQSLVRFPRNMARKVLGFDKRRTLRLMKVRKKSQTSVLNKNG